MIDFELSQGYDVCLDNESKLYDSAPCVNNKAVHRFGSKVFLVISFFTAAVSSAICQDLDFELEVGGSTPILEYVEKNPQQSFLDNRFLLDSSLKGIMDYSDSWWENYDAEKPEQVTFDNVVRFFDVNKNDALLKNAEVLPSPNATLLIEWDSDSFMCSLYIGETEFSYSILPLSDLEKPLLGQASMEEEKAILEFFNLLETVYA